MTHYPIAVPHPMPRHEQDAITATMGPPGPARKALEDRLIAGNMPFVIQVAGEFSRSGVDVEDLIGEGYVGLCVAAKRYDPARGWRFLTYAVWWIRNHIIAAVHERHTVHVPVNRQKQDGWTAYPKEASIETPREVGMDNPHCLADILADDAPLPDELAERASTARFVRKRLDGLSPRDARILTRYFGLDGRGGATLAAIGAEEHLTKERVRQLKKRALKQIRRNIVTNA